MTTEADDKQPEPLPQESDEAELRQAAQSELAQLREAARFATPERAVQVLEALFFAADKPLDMPTLLEATQLSEELLQTAIGGALGNVAIKLGKKLDWDGPNLKVTNVKEAADLINPPYRKGWTLPA